MFEMVKYLSCLGGIPNSGGAGGYQFWGYPISPHKKRLPHRGEKPMMNYAVCS